MKKNGPDFIVPGYPKCGTTWLFNRLNELPEFKMTDRKELHFFNRDKKYNKGDAGSTRNYFEQRKSILRAFGYDGVHFFVRFLKFWESNDNTYIGLFNEVEKYSGDITPLYILLNEKGISKLAEKLDGVKLVFILRDPIDRAWSQFRMQLKKDNLEFNLCTEKYIRDFFSDSLKSGRGKYKESIELFKKHFVKSDFLFAFYDDLEKKPKAFLEDITRFIIGNDIEIKENDNIYAKDHVSKKVNIEEWIYEILKNDLKYQYEWLVQEFPEKTQKWMEMHYKN